MQDHTQPSSLSICCVNLMKLVGQYALKILTYLIVVKPVTDLAEMERMSLLIKRFMKSGNVLGILPMRIMNVLLQRYYSFTKLEFNAESSYSADILSSLLLPVNTTSASIGPQRISTFARRICDAFLTDSPPPTWS